jgi:hypothetical protein
VSRQNQVCTTEIAPPTAAQTVTPPVVDAVDWKDAPAKPDAPPAPPRPLKAAKVRGRTTRVILRHLDPWSVLKLSLVYYTAVFLVILVAGVLLWAGAEAVGVVGNIENFMVDIGFEDFTFVPSKLLSGVALGGLVLVVAGTFANVLMTALFNLMGDIVGGLKLTLQEDGPQPSAKDEGNATV